MQQYDGTRNLTWTRRSRPAHATTTQCDYADEHGYACRLGAGHEEPHTRHPSPAELKHGDMVRKTWQEDGGPVTRYGVFLEHLEADVAGPRCLCWYPDECIGQDAGFPPERVDTSDPANLSDLLALLPETARTPRPLVAGDTWVHVSICHVGRWEVAVDGHRAVAHLPWVADESTILAEGAGDNLGEAVGEAVLALWEASHCCRRFVIPCAPARLPRALENMAAAKAHHELHGVHPNVVDLPWPKIPIYQDIEKIADMVVFIEAVHEDAGVGFYYTCRHHDPETGDCRDYENRPDMCSRTFKVEDETDAAGIDKA